jgi:hypothetical protein
MICQSADLASGSSASQPLLGCLAFDLRSRQERKRSDLGRGRTKTAPQRCGKSSQPKTASPCQTEASPKSAEPPRSLDAYGVYHGLGPPTEGAGFEPANRVTRLTVFESTPLDPAIQS